MTQKPKRISLDTNMLDRFFDDSELLSKVLLHQSCGTFEYLSSVAQLSELHAINRTPEKRPRLVGLAKTYVQVNPKLTNSPLASEKIHLSASEDFSRNFFLEIHKFNQHRHPGQNDCVIAITAAANQSLVATDDRDFIKNLAEFTMSFEAFTSELSLHNDLCDGQKS